MAALGLISDVHATAAPVQEALAIFKRAGVDQVLCAGDIAGYHEEVEETVALLIDNDVQAVRGNHDLRYLDRCGEHEDGPVAAYFRQLPAVLDIDVAGRRVYVVHAEPPDACDGGGQSHQVFTERLGNTLVVNPGSSVFNHSCAILRLPEMTVQMLPLSGGPIRKTWNWADYMAGKG